MKEQNKTTSSNYFIVIIKWHKFIIRNVIIVTVFAIIISLLLQNKYTATATILPPNPNQDMMFGLLPSFTYGGATGFSSLAKLGNIVSGISTLSDMYAAIMQSSRIKGEIIKKYNLKKIFKAKTMHDAGKALDEITKIGISPEGIISVSVTYQNKHLATDIANSYVEELDKFNTETAMTVGKKYRIFIEQRLKDNHDSLIKAEEDLRNFQEKHKTVVLDEEIKSAIETIARLKSEIILREVQKGATTSSSHITNPYIQNIEQELRELKRQLSKIEFGGKGTNEFGAGFSIPFVKLPELSLEYARLLRDVKVQEAIYELLTQQFEQAKIMELKDTPTVQFLDKAGIPEKKSYPKRSLIVIFAFVLSIFCSILIAFLLDYVENVKTNPQKHQMLMNFVETFSNDFLKLKTYFKSKFKK